MRFYSYLLIAMLANYDPELKQEIQTQDMLIMEKTHDALDGQGENKYRQDLEENIIQKQEEQPLKSTTNMSKKRARHH